MFLYTNSLTVTAPLLFVNEIFKRYAGEENNRYLNPRNEFLLSFYLGTLNGYELDHASILRGIAEITSETNTFWVEIKRVEIMEDPVAGVYVGLVPESGAKEMKALFETLFTRKLVEEIEDNVYMPYISLGWISSPTIAKKVTSEINNHQFAIKWSINELTMGENIFPLKTS
jgi:hypothetical protein